MSTPPLRRDPQQVYNTSTRADSPPLLPPPHGAQNPAFDSVSLIPKPENSINSSSGGSSNGGSTYTAPRAGSQWGIHWFAPLSMMFMLFCGVAGAMGHHIYYSKLAGTLANHQEWTVRFGNGFATFTQASLAASVGISFRQRIWVTMRRKFLRILSIDDLFSAPSNPLAFINMEMVYNAKTATILALCIWAMPILTIFTPGAISVVNEIHEHTKPCTIKNLDFTPQNIRNLRTQTLGPGLENLEFDKLDSWKYQGPSASARAIASRSIFGGTILDAGSPCGVNCTYQQNFTGPAYKCEEVTPYNVTELHACDVKAYWPGRYPIQSTTRMCSALDYNCTGCGKGCCDPFYRREIKSYADAAIQVSPPEYGTYYYAVNGTATCDLPEMKNDRDCDGPVFEGDGGGNIWITYRYLPKEYRNETLKFTAPDVGTAYSELPPARETFVGLMKLWEKRTLRCTDYTAEYKLNMTYKNSVLAVQSDVKYIKPVSYGLTYFPDGGRKLARRATGSSPMSNYYDVNGYWSNWVIHQLLLETLTGEIAARSRNASRRAENEWETVDTSQIGTTKLVESEPWPGRRNNSRMAAFLPDVTLKPVQDLAARVVELHRNVTMSIMVSPSSRHVFQESKTCIFRENQQVYKYEPLVLWLSYSIGITASLISLVIGLVSLEQNGLGSDTSFSRIIMTTRNPTLDKMAAGACLGGDPFPKALEKTTLMFGELLSGGAPHAGFGTPDETTALVKGKDYR